MTGEGSNAGRKTLTNELLALIAFFGISLVLVVGMHLAPSAAAPAPAMAAFITTTPSLTPTFTPTVSTTPEPTPSPTPTGVPTSTPPPIEPTPQPNQFRVAFFADTFYSLIDEQDALEPDNYIDRDLGLPARTLKLVHAESADLALVGGDLGYDITNDPAIPERWDRMISLILGEDYPLFVTRGNHDMRDWESAAPDPDRGFTGLGYRDVMMRRLEAVENSAIADDIACTFATGPTDIGTKSTCVYKDALTFISSGLGSGNQVPPTDFDEPDNAFEAYLKAELDASTTPWTVCNWHFNQSMFQTGFKRNEAGWKPYEYCREAGALIATGHEHAYSRTSVLTRFGLDSNPSHIVDVGHELTIDEGRTLAWVSGLGGQSIRFPSAMAQLPWWEALVNATNQSRADGAGVLFCDFSTDANANASCFFKTVDGVVHDRFEIVSQANGGSGTFSQILDSPNLAPIVSDLSVDGTIGRSISPVSITASDADGPDALEYWSNDLPAGITMSRTTGALSGTPKVAGTQPSTVHVWDGAEATTITVTFEIEPELLSATVETYCVAERGWVDVRVRNASASFTRTAEVSVTNLDPRTVSVAPQAEELVRRTGRPNGVLTVVVTSDAGARVLEEQVEVNCTPPLKVSCLAGNGRVDAYLYNRGSSSATYTVTVGALAPRSRIVGSYQTTRVTVTGRPDGALPVTIARNGTVERSETVSIACDPRPPSGWEIKDSCLAANGRVDVYLWNDGDATATYTVTFGSLDPRSRAIGPGATERITVTGRPDGTLPMRILRNGSLLHSESRLISCD